ncbi:hypothetical protein NE237_024507 [Protea cynaroides]|uniref:Uncharacterized protein n=1 Tax=Protea cynaroides TaxID=273540 RepID=A0A9Q0H011_9MAGN|nr:hypothetical protein NE237_024507 [Protea cynaroides]
MVSLSVVSSANVIVGNLAGPAVSFAAGKPSGSERTMFDLDRKSEIAEWLLQIFFVVHDGRSTLEESRTAPVGKGNRNGIDAVTIFQRLQREVCMLRPGHVFLQMDECLMIELQQGCESVIHTAVFAECW